MNQDGHDLTNNTLDGAPASPEITPQPQEQPVQSTPLSPTMPPHESHKSKRKAILIAICTLVLLALIGGLGYILTKNYPAKESPSATTTPTAQEEDSHETMSAAEHVTSELKTKITGEQQRIDSENEYGGTGATDGSVYTTAAYQSGDQEFAVYPVKPYGFGTTSTAEMATSDLATVTSYLTDNSFTETPAESGIFASDSAVCAVRLIGDGTEKTLNGISVGCGNVSDYDKSYQVALPFYTAYIASKPNAAQNLLLSSPVIKDGTEGYKNAYVSISSSLPDATGGFAGLFYSMPSADKWTFFIGTQSDLSCELFNTDTLKKAFSGQRCINMATNQESTVTST